MSTRKICILVLFWGLFSIITLVFFKTLCLKPIKPNFETLLLIKIGYFIDPYIQINLCPVIFYDSFEQNVFHTQKLNMMNINIDNVFESRDTFNNFLRKYYNQDESDLIYIYQNFSKDLSFLDNKKFLSYGCNSKSLKFIILYTEFIELIDKINLNSSLNISYVLVNSDKKNVLICSKTCEFKKELLNKIGLPNYIYYNNSLNTCDCNLDLLQEDYEFIWKCK